MSQASSSLLRRRWWLWPLLLLVVVLLIWWLWPGKSAKAPAPGGFPGFAQEAVPVRVETVQLGDFPVQLKALGTVTAYNTVNVVPRVDGLLAEVRFAEGQRVKKDAVLAVLDQRPFRVALQQAEGDLQQNRAQLRNAEIDLKRYQGLFAEDSIAKQTLDTQAALVNQYRGTIAASQAAVDQARLNLAFSEVRAPIGGRLGLRQVDVGNLVGSGDTTPLVSITQTSPIAVVFTVPEVDVGDVVERYRAGERLQVEAWNRDETRLLATGTLASLDNQIDTATGTLRLKADFSNDDEKLYPNAFVNVRLRVRTLQQAPMMPADALQFGARGTFVYLLGEGDKVSLRNVEVGPGDGLRNVVESGLQPGDRVVVEGTDRLREGAKVEVIDGAPGAAEPATLPVRGSEKAGGADAS